MKIKDYNQDGTIKKNSIFTVHTIKDGANGERVLLGTIKLINMIPIPMRYVIGYSIENEADSKYRNVVSDEFKWIAKTKTRSLSVQADFIFSKPMKQKRRTQTTRKSMAQYCLLKKLSNSFPSMNWRIKWMGNSKQKLNAIVFVC